MVSDYAMTRRFRGAQVASAEGACDIGATVIHSLSG